MGFRDELDKADIRVRAANILRICGDEQCKDINNESIALIANIWCDIYKAMEIKEVKVNEH